MPFFLRKIRPTRKAKKAMIPAAICSMICGKNCRNTKNAAIAATATMASRPPFELKFAMVKLFDRNLLPLVAASRPEIRKRFGGKKKG